MPVTPGERACVLGEGCGRVRAQEHRHKREGRVSLRCAAYARYSTDKQRPVSLEDQIRKCREFAQAQGWQFLESEIYSDQAISGATDARPGLNQLLEAARSRTRSFDVILVDDTSRLSRDLESSLRICKRLKFDGVRVVYVSQGIDTESEQFEVLVATHGIVDSLYISELAKKVHRGMEGRALQGLHTGGRCFGYRSVPIEDSTQRDNFGRPKIVGVRLEIDLEQAAIVRRIFMDYAAGGSMKDIAKRSNREGVPSPGPYRGQRHPSWSHSAISVMLRNDRYRGMAIWNRTRKVRDPQTGRRIQRPRPPSEWRLVELPELRIVSDELWDKVQAQRALQAAFSGSRAGLCSRSYSARYLFSGFLKCGICRSNLVLISGRGRAAWGKYGCPLHHQRGVCNNTLLIRRDKLETEILSGLQREVLREEVAAYAVEEFGRQLRARLEVARKDIAGIRQKQEKLKFEIANIAKAIAEGHQSPTLLAELGKRENELEALNNELLAEDGRGLDARLEEMEAFVGRRLQDVRSLLLADVPRAKAELAKYCTAIVLIPEGSGYRVSGEWDLLGGRSGGAGGRNRTADAGLFRAALYL